MTVRHSLILNTGATKSAHPELVKLRHAVEPCFANAETGRGTSKSSTFAAGQPKVLMAEFAGSVKHHFLGHVAS